MDALFADILEQGLDLRLKVTGRSMAPFIKSGEIVILHKVPTDSLHCGDIIYFMDDTGKAVLHRIVAKEIKTNGKANFTTRGDALLQHDDPIPEDQILAKAAYVEKVMPLIEPIQLDMDSVFCKSFNLVYGLYRTVRHRFLNRTMLRKLLLTKQ
jgi:signal peptidase I